MALEASTLSLPLAGDSFGEMTFEFQDLMEEPDFGVDFEGECISYDGMQQLPQAFHFNMPTPTSSEDVSSEGPANNKVSLVPSTNRVSLFETIHSSMFIPTSAATHFTGCQGPSSPVNEKDHNQCLFYTSHYGVVGGEAWEGTQPPSVDLIQKACTFSGSGKLLSSSTDMPVRPARPADYGLLTSLSGDSLGDTTSSFWDSAVEESYATTQWGSGYSSSAGCSPLLNHQGHALDTNVANSACCDTNVGDHACSGIPMHSPLSVGHDFMSIYLGGTKHTSELVVSDESLEAVTSSPMSESFAIPCLPWAVSTVEDESMVPVDDVSDMIRVKAEPLDKPKGMTGPLNRSEESVCGSEKSSQGIRPRSQMRRRVHPVSKFPGEHVCWNPENNDYSSADDTKGNLRKKRSKSRRCGRRGRPRSARVYSRPGRRGRWEGADGNRRRKPHNPWTLVETQALIRGVETCGGGKWADIKRLGLKEIMSRTPVDLKDKWRNLLRVARLSPEEIKIKKIDRRQDLPLELLKRVRELAEGYSSK